MKALKYILFLLLIVIIGLAIFIAVQPNEFEFSRSKVIKAPTSMVFNKVNDFKNWPDFSPWIEQEPNATLTYGEKTSGVDGTYSWSGEVLGEGSMKTTALEQDKSISQHISFIKPFESESDINWTFENTDEGTKVTWGMKGKQDFMTKMYTTFAGSIEENTGPDFDRGLFKLDSIVNADMKKYSINIEGITQHGGGYYLYSTTSCKISELESKMPEMMSKVGSYAMNNNINMAGAPYTYYHKWDVENNATMFSACVPTTERVITAPDSDILTGQLKPFKAVKTTLKGNYENLKETWEATMTYIPANGLEFTQDGPMLEVYPTDPMNTPNPADWITEIYIAVK
ncbi:GyrI-like domain-containing protein [Sabulilitoribacter multivorans]|uniref:GyrI-like domain-containing protein n=1 Tax=Flaviramulus multivorans TaxID=1304750 RepID=A0ABS9ILN9_9FLAO|nr:GyrI-like domain-containing protein [Flaviramulus multivorans]MCF7561500.1 GyrI-like domain-containing protein [Flaviramulus multivorans]